MPYSEPSTDGCCGSYCTRADVEARFHPENVLAWADDNGSGELEPEEVEVVQDAIQRASTLINTRLGDAYSVPFTNPVPALVKDIATDLAGYMLYSRRGPGEGTFFDVGREALERLRSIEHGRIGLDKCKYQQPKEEPDA